MPTVVKLRTTNVSAHVRPGSLKYGPLEIGHKISTATFTLNESAPFIPEDHDYVEVTLPDSVTLAFAGKVRQPSRARLIDGKKVYPVAASSWGADLERIVVTSTETYAAGKTDRSIVEDLLTKYYGPIATSVSHVIYSARSDMPAITFTAGAKTLRQALDLVATEAFGVSWFIDPQKKLHWNDIQVDAAFFLSDRPTDGHKEFRDLRKFSDASREMHRVKVKGSGGVEYEATDWMGWAHCNRRLADQPGAPTFCFGQASDITDTALTTVEQCKQRAFSELEAAKERTMYRFYVHDAGLLPGRRIYLRDRVFGSEAQGFFHHGEGPAFPSATPELQTAIGPLIVQRVTPQPLLENDSWRFDVEAGSYEPSLAVALAKV